MATATKISTRKFQEGISRRDADIERNKALADLETKKRAVRELAESITDMERRLAVNDPNYKEVEKRHLQELEAYISSSSGLGESNRSEEKKFSTLSRQNSELTAAISANAEKARAADAAAKKAEENRSKKTSEATAVMAKLNAELSSTRALLAEFKKELRSETSKLRTTKLAAKKAMEEITREHAVLAIMKADLDIYLSRMRKTYPDVTFILNGEAV